jgi:hypothetical protein
MSDPTHIMVDGQRVDLTQEQIDAIKAEWELAISPAVLAAKLAARRDAIADDMEQLESYTRAFALVVLDELNLHAARTTAILNAIDTGSNLAAVKTNIAGIADVPQRTIAQLKTAVRNKLGT